MWFILLSIVRYNPIIHSVQHVLLCSRKHAAMLEQASGGLISSITSFVCILPIRKFTLSSGCARKGENFFNLRTCNI